MGVVPAYVLDALGRYARGRVRDAALRTRSTDIRPAARRTAGVDAAGRSCRPRERLVYDGRRETVLPGLLVRTESLRKGGDADVDRAYDMAGRTLEFYAQVFGRDSIDDRGMSIVSTVHYGLRFQNAFWNGAQMVYGDGDGEAFLSFTSCLEIAAHELAHAVTQIDAGFAYDGESGALGESIADVFGSLVKQHALRQTFSDADWIIGAGIFGPEISGAGLRSLAAPGSAYDDPLLGGRDPQPAHMREYVRDAPSEDLVHSTAVFPTTRSTSSRKRSAGMPGRLPGGSGTMRCGPASIARAGSVPSRSRRWMPHGRTVRASSMRCARRGTASALTHVRLWRTLRQAQGARRLRVILRVISAAGGADDDAVVFGDGDRVERVGEIVHRRANLLA